MKSCVVITSMDEAYYQKVGRACIESFSSNWPKNMPLFVYDEGIVDPPKRKSIEYRPWVELGENFENFCQRDVSGRVKTFAKKAFSIIAGLKNIDVDRVIWLDADVVTTYPINSQLIDMITPDDVLSTHYGVQHEWPSDYNPARMCFSCETGFFIVNRRHPEFNNFLSRYEQYYVEYLDRDLRRFYDGDVYGAVVQEFENRGVKMLELNPGLRHKTPIPRSVMAPYITHYKAGAKDPYDSQQLLEKHHIKNEDSNLS